MKPLMHYVNGENVEMHLGMVNGGLQQPEDCKSKELGLVMKAIANNEMAFHCRRKTRQAEKTSVLLFQLLETFCGDQGLDTLGVPLLDAEKTWEIWKSQECHVECIQDLQNVQLYILAGTLVKGLFKQGKKDY